MAARLLHHAVAGVDEQDRDIGGGCARGHVARVLLVPRSVGEDPLPAGCREVPVGDVDRDALLALRLEPVREEREIDRAGGPALRRSLDGPDLILVHAARVVQQPSDQRALPIVDASGRADAEQIRHQK
jgi:hypothetical protein